MEQKIRALLFSSNPLGVNYMVKAKSGEPLTVLGF